MDSKTKKIITEEWIKAFPDLSSYTQNKLYKIVGPCVLGLELINLPRSEDYRPHFVIYSLWKNSVKSCLEYPVLMQEFFNSKKLQIDLPYKDINCKYKEAQGIVLNSLNISLTDNITLEKLYTLIDDVSQNDITCKFNSGKVASLFELKFYSALYTANQSQIQSVLNQIQNASKNWNMQMFEVWYGKFDLWIQGLQEKASNREDFIMQIEANKQDKKISQLKSSELTV
jgi:hypothetical protein